MTKKENKTIVISTLHGDFIVNAATLSETATVGESVKLELPLYTADNYFILNGNMFGMLGDAVRVSLFNDGKVIFSVNEKGVVRQINVYSSTGAYNQEELGSDYISFPGYYKNGYMKYTNDYGRVGDPNDGNILYAQEYKEVAYPCVFRMRRMRPPLLSPVVYEEDMTDAEKYLYKDDIFKHTFPYIICPNLYYCIYDSETDESYLYDSIRIEQGTFFIFNEKIDSLRHRMYGLRL